MTIKSLKEIGYDVILEAFNLSFSDYFIPVSVNYSQFTTKLKSHDIDLSLSVGAFDKGKLVGFILHCTLPYLSNSVAYNLGTGVIPNARGQNLTVRMYEHIIPIISNTDCDKIQLEVITKNSPAIDSYKKSGFKINMHLLCFRGVPRTKKANSDCSYEELKKFDWEHLQSFWTSNPTIQNSPALIENRFQELTSIGAYKDEELIGYIVFNQNERIFCNWQLTPSLDCKVWAAY
jgi:GNAT superfamily N-acetyltransferase